MIDITGLDKYEVVAALYNNARQLGLGLLNERGRRGITAAQVRELPGLELGGPTGWAFDYLHGRLLKVDVSGGHFDPTWYDRDNGVGSAYEAIQALRVAEAKRKGECA